MELSPESGRTKTLQSTIHPEANYLAAWCAYCVGLVWWKIQ